MIHSEPSAPYHLAQIWVTVTHHMVKADPSRRLLLTWSDRGIDGPTPGHHTARPAGDRGPVLRLLEHTERKHRYQHALVLTVPAGARRARELAQDMREHVAEVDVRVLDLEDPSDYGALWAHLAPLAAELAARPERSGAARASAEPPTIDVLLSAGTPQAQTLWVILVQAELLRARMLQVIPPAFVPRPHPRALREVRLDLDGFPQIRALRAEVERLRAQTAVGRSQLVAASEPMRALLTRVARVAASELPVLVHGETGSGKELVARALHQGSPRAAGPFVAESCGALAESVLASELFGHEAGAFTGANKVHRGLFEQAHGGTIFLDEVGELSPQVQAMLLRVLQERTLRRVGGERSIAVDVRVVAATHRDLAQMVRDGRFREDLYYRLGGVTLHVPPLRERLADLPAMIRLFQQEAAGKGQRPPTVTAAALRALAAYPWPGNVRQLRSEVLRWSVLCDDEVDVADLSPELVASRRADAGAPTIAPTGAPPTGAPVDLPTERPAPAAPTRGALGAAQAEPAPPRPLTPLAEVTAAAERAAVEHALAVTGGNLARAARALEIERNTLKRKLRRWGLRAELPAAPPGSTAAPRRAPRAQGRTR